MAIYRHDWTMPTTGWRWRLDIVPYDGALSDSAESMTADNTPRLLPTVVIERSFDELPVGLANASTCTVTLVWSALKSDLKTRIRNKFSGDARNTFLLYSDRGAGITPATLEFAGVQATIAGGTVTRDESGEYIYEAELVDAVYATLAATSGAVMCAGYTDAFPQPYPTAWEVNFGGNPKRSAAFQSARFEDTRLSAGFRLATPVEIWTHIRGTLSARLKTIAGRTVATGAAVNVAFDYTLRVPRAFDDVVRFFRQQPTTYPRAANATPLDKDSVQFISTVFDRDGNRIGGLMSPNDKLGYARYESAWDFMKDFAETFGVKMYYQIVQTTTGGNPYLRVEWFVLPAIVSQGGKTTVESGRALEVGDLEDEAPTVGKAEVRAVYAQPQPTTDYIVNGGVTRAERSFNVQCTIASNLPTSKSDTKAGDLSPGSFSTQFVDMISKGLFETNMVMERTGDPNNPTKAHEKTRIYYTWADYVEVDDAISADPPSLTTSAQREAHNLWVGEVQAKTGLPRAIAEFYAVVFGRDDLAYIEITWPTQGATVNPDEIGRIHEVTGTLATEAAGFGWDTAIIVASTFDAVAGTIKLKYLLWK